MESMDMTDESALNGLRLDNTNVSLSFDYCLLSLLAAVYLGLIIYLVR